MTYYGIKRPDGTLVRTTLIATFPVDAWKYASQVEAPASDATNEHWKSGESWGARCWRAAGDSFGWWGAAAREIGILMGYRLVEVEATERVSQVVSG